MTADWNPETGPSTGHGVVSQSEDVTKADAQGCARSAAEVSTIAVALADRPSEEPSVYRHHRRGRAGDERRLAGGEHLELQVVGTEGHYHIAPLLDTCCRSLA